MDGLALVLLVLAVLGVTVVLPLALVVVTMVVSMRRLRHRNRVSPIHDTQAPLVWLWSPRAAARLHRRLQAAVSVARMIALRHRSELDRPRTAELALELECEAVAVDHRLALVGRLPAAARSHAMGHVLADVRRIEAVASRLSLLEVDSATPARLAHEPSALEDLAAQLDRLEDARREVRAAEARAGLRSEPSIPALPHRARR